jgi:hypothetical protein
VTHRLFVLTHGWVIVGRVEDVPESGWIHLASSAIVRRWGTTKGPGELASGPLSGTIYDRVPSPTQVPCTSVVWSCDVEGWGV